MSIVNRAIEDALRDGRESYRTRGVLVESDLKARGELETHEPALYQSLYTIFRALPERLTRGATLRVATRDRPGGDIEVAWEAMEAAPSDGQGGPGEIRLLMRDGPYGDLIDVALITLEEFCRARMGTLRKEDGSRRVLALIPPIRRRAGSYEREDVPPL